MVWILFFFSPVKHIFMHFDVNPSCVIHPRGNICAYTFNKTTKYGSAWCPAKPETHKNLKTGALFRVNVCLWHLKTIVHSFDVLSGAL